MPGYGERLAIPGTHNFRDLGGYPVTGGHIAPGRLYRSEALAYPGAGEMHAVWDEHNAEAIRDLGISTVVDLRSTLERDVTAAAWPDATDAETVWVEMAEGGEGSDTNVMRAILSREITTFSGDDMARLYCAVLDRRADVIGSVVQVLADAERLPVVVHCSAGKDRTGIVVAVLLAALGTPRDLVVHDYQLTEQFRPLRVQLYADMLADAGIVPHDVRVLFETPAIAMEAMLDHLDSIYGGAASYLTGAAGLSDETLEAVRSNLVEAHRA